jgi:hypothetical protein
LVFLIQATNITKFILYTVYHPFNYEGHHPDELDQKNSMIEQNDKKGPRNAKNRGYLKKKDKKIKNKVKK